MLYSWGRIFLPVNLIKTLSIRCSRPRALTFGQIHTTEFILGTHLFHPKFHIALSKLLLKEVLLVLKLLSAHLKPKGKQISRKLWSPRLGWPNFHFFSSIIFYPKKSVEKIGFTQYFQAEEYRTSLCSIWSSFPKHTQNPNDTTTCG